MVAFSILRSRVIRMVNNLTLRIGTYVTLAAGIPTVVDAQYETVIYDVNAKLGNNSIINKLRDGRTRKISDPKVLYRTEGSLILAISDIDLRSLATFGGTYRYLANNLFHHARNKLPIVLFIQGLNNFPHLAYAATIEDFDQAVTGQAIDNDIEMMHFSRMTTSKTWKMSLRIFLTGAWVTFGTIGTVDWESRA